MAFSSIPKFWRKEKPTARSLLAVGSGDSLKIALLHPIPSSRRRVIRVDVIVAVVVIRFPFWRDILINRSQHTFEGTKGQMQNCDTEHRNSGLRAARATPDEASGATLAIAYVGADASSASPGEVRRDGSPDRRNVKPPNRVRFAPSPSQNAAITSFPSAYSMKVLCK
jgi:hypothetical protein